MQRNITLDTARTAAIFLMVVFHFIYDLSFFNFIQLDIPDGRGWQQFRWLIISLFFLCLGASLTFSHSVKLNVYKFFKRWSQIAISAAVISIATFQFIPQNWIFFGVLHFLAFASLIVVFFVRFPRLSCVIGLSIIMLGLAGVMPSRWPWDMLFPTVLPHYTNDFVDIAPWLGMVFLGVTLAHSHWLLSDPFQSFISSLGKQQQRIILWPGRHSLLIYLVHQPILFGVLFLTEKIV